MACMWLMMVMMMRLAKGFADGCWHPVIVRLLIDLWRHRRRWHGRAWLTPDRNSEKALSLLVLFPSRLVDSPREELHNE